MSTENPTYWTKKSDRPRAIEPVVLARKINEDWLQSSVYVTHYQFTGDLRRALMDLLDASPRKTRSGTNLPTISLRLMLQISLQDVLSVDRHLGCKSSQQNYGINYAVETLGQQEENGCETVARIVREWAMSSLEPWSMDKDCSDIAMRVKSASLASNVSAATSPTALRDARSGSLRFSLVGRLLADQLRGQKLFEGLDNCELVLPGPFNDSSFELITPPRLLPSNGQASNSFSMVARVQVSTMPCTTAAYVSVVPSKRVWTSSMPNGGNTGRRATAYAFPPVATDSDALRAIIPISVERRSADEAYRWEFNADEYAVIKDQAGISRLEAPDTLAVCLTESAQDKSRWWMGLPQTTRLYQRVDQHTPTDTDEVELMQRCASLLEGFADEEIRFELRALPLNKSSTTAMIKSEDCGTVGAALLESDTEPDDDDEDESDEATGPKSELKLAAFRDQCIRVLDKVYAGARPTLWLLGGTPDEMNMAEHIVRHLFGDVITFKRDPMPLEVHGLQKELPGADLPAKQRFNLRVAKWKDTQNPGGLLNAIAAHQGPKFVLVCAPKEIGHRQEDAVNRRAAIHAICSHTGAAVHHVLPMEIRNTPARQARARQQFIHRMQSAMTDVMLAHSGHIINVAAFARERIPKKCGAIWGIQALRKNAQMYSGETPVCMLVYTKINLTTDTTEVQFHYGSGSRIQCSTWMPLAKGLVWLATQRDINSDERWLRANFETQTRKFLIQTQEVDPYAVVLIDWGTMAGLWKNLTDEKLTTAPALGNMTLSTAFPHMSFVRIRYGFNAKISVRGKSTSYYEAIRYEEASMVLTGNVYRDEYATTTKRLLEIVEEAPASGVQSAGATGSYRASHFIGMMTPRKTSQGKRGLSCFRSVTLMNKVGRGKGQDSIGTLYELGVRSPASKDNSSPSPIDITVLQHPSAISAQDLAVLTMGLRLGYPHYDEWTLLPAPLFFIRKIDDYIIKYPQEAESGQEQTDDALGVVADTSQTDIPDTDADTDSGGAVVPAFELVSQMVQKELNFEVEKEPDLPEPQPATEADAEPVEVDPDINLALDAAGRYSPELLLQLAKNVKYPELLPFEGPDGMRKRKFFNGMMRGDTPVTVEVPYFVNLAQIFSLYGKPDRTSINRVWRNIRESGTVRQSGQQQPSDFTGWLARKLQHPQGAYLTSPRTLFGRAFFLPQFDALVVGYNASVEEPEAKLYYEGDVDLSPIVSKACTENDDEALGWLIFGAAQCPTLGIARSVMESLTCVPGSRTKAALIYYVQCAQAVQKGLAQISASFHLNTASFTPIQLKRPHEFSTVTAPEPTSEAEPCGVSKLTTIAKAVQTALSGVAAQSSEQGNLPQGRMTAPKVGSETPQQATLEFPEPYKTEATDPLDLSDPIMQIKTEISRILLSLEPGQNSFAPEMEQLRALLDDLERIDSTCKNEAERANEVAMLCRQCSEKALDLLKRIEFIDEEDIVQARSYRPVAATQDQLESIQNGLAAIEESVLTAEKANESLQACLSESVSETEKRRHARVVSALDIQLEEHLGDIQRKISTSSCYVGSGPNDPEDTPKTTLDERLGSPELPSQNTAGQEVDGGPESEPTGVTTQIQDQAAADHLPSPETSDNQTETPILPVLAEVAEVAQVEAEDPLPLDVAKTEADSAGEALLDAIGEVKEASHASTTPTDHEVKAQNESSPVLPTIGAPQVLPPIPPTVVASSPGSLKRSVLDATAGEDKEFGKALANLRTLIEKRHFGLASVYIEAIDATFGDQQENSLNCALLQALTTELDSVDCNSMVQPKFNQWQSRVFGEIDQADGIPQAIGMLGAGLASAIFYDPGNGDGNPDPLWSVLGPVMDKLQDQSSLAALIAHVASREKNAVILTQNKLVLSFASSEDRIAAQLESYRERAKNWRNDASLHNKWSHNGFARAHDYIYSEETAVGKCLALLARDDVKTLKSVMKDFSGKFRKPKSTIEEAFRKIRDRTELNGGYLVHAVNNLETTEAFLKEYIELSERKSNSGKSVAILQHEREYIKALHARLKDAILEVDEIINSGRAWTTLESLYLQAGRRLLQSVMRLFDDSKADACIPSDIQRLLIQAPMGLDLMPSFKTDPAYNVKALLQADALIESINSLLYDDLRDQTQPIGREAMDRLLQVAQDCHIANSRFLPAWRIEALLGRPKNRSQGEQQPSLLNQYTRACTDLQRKLQELRQRVTHAMALSALSQKDASNMLYTVSSIESVLKQGQLGKPDCRSPSFPDFPHAYFDINESITKVLDSRMQEATGRLQASLQNLRELKGSEIQRDADRIERMLATKKPADLRAAHDAIRLLDAGQKLPTSSPQRTQETPKKFDELVLALSKIQRQKDGMLESLIYFLKQAPAQTDPPIFSHLDTDQRQEAVTFIESWIELCAARGGDAAQRVSDMFSALGLGVPHFAPESSSRGNTPARLEFPPNPFARLSSDCFIPPQLGSQQNCLPIYAIHGNRPDNEISTLIHDLATNPVVILARTTMTLNKRLRTVDKGTSVILIEDFLVAFMALHQEDRAQKILEIGLLNFHTNPYSAEGAHVAREMFFGRQAELTALRAVKNAAILYGGRRLGKSSLLAQIERDENRPDSGRRALYIPMNKDYSGTDHVLFAWRTIYEHLVSHQIIKQMTESTDSAQSYADWIETGLVSSPTRHCYLLLDEADDLMAAELELPHGRPGFVRTLQNISESLAPRGVALRYCIAGLHNLARMTTEVNSALGKAETIALEPFTSDEDILRGIELITKPMAALGFYFDADSIDLPLRIMSVCNFYPAFIQIYCRKLVSYMHNKRSGTQPYCSITLDDIERVENDHDLLADLSKKFSMTLDLDTRYKAIALILADHYYSEIENGTNDGATMQEIREMCDTYVSSHFKNINTSAYESLLDEMRKLNVLEKSGNKYRLRNPSIAMLLGDKERVEAQIQDLASLPPSRSRNHGEKRVFLQPNVRSKTSDPLPIFPMPISWIHAQVGGKRTLDGSLPILCGNWQSGLKEISTPKLAAKLTQTDDYYCHPVSYAEMSTFVRTKVGMALVPQNGNLLLLSASSAWKTSEINSFASLALRIAPTKVQLALSALPPRLWEMICHLKEQQAKGSPSPLAKWSIVPVPPYSIDAIQFHLGDNRAVADSQDACENIRYATCGFGRLVQKHCSESLTVERTAALRTEAEAGFAASLESFYESIAMPVDVISAVHLRHMETALTLMDGEPRLPTLLNDINELMKESFRGQPDLDPFDILYLQWMGLLQEGQDNKWLVPPLYRRLLKS